MFTGLSAFPLTPMRNDEIDEGAFTELIGRLVSAGVDAIGVLGSTGSSVYLTRNQRKRATQLAVENAGGIPVMAGIGALGMCDVLRLSDDAQQAGADGVLLAPVSYQPLTEEEVYGLYEKVTSAVSVPMCVYDNPVTTHFRFSDDLHGAIARLKGVQSIKIPGVPDNAEAARERVLSLRSRIPSDVTIGVSGDMFGATGLNAGCEVWYSALAGLHPEPCLRIARAAFAGSPEEAERASERLAPIWSMFRKYGSLRVVAALAELQGIVEEPCLPLPLKGLNAEARRELSGMLAALEEVTALGRLNVISSGINCDLSTDD